MEKMSRENNFDAVRLIAAAAVIYGHAHPLTQSPEVVVMGNSVQALAVKVFFALSGFLVTTSWQRNPNPISYLQKRALRLFPGLILLLVLTVFLLGPLLTKHSMQKYFSDASTWRYFFYNIFLNPNYSLGGLFSGNPYPNAVNGSLWSLPVEFFMYLLMPCILIISRIGGNSALFSFFTFCLAAASLWALRSGMPLPTEVYYGSSLSSILDVAPYFFIGATFAVSKFHKILNPGTALFLVAIAVFFQPSSAIAKELMLYFVLPISVLSLGISSTPILNRAGRFGDFSYGLYLYGFVVQQVFLLFNPEQAALANTLWSLAVSLILAAVSWHLVEKRALRMKNRFPETGSKQTHHSPKGDVG